MKTLEEIINDYENKKYQAEYPNRDNYKFIENEDETIKQNRERKLKLENDYKTNVSEYRKKQSILSEKLKDDIIKTQIGCGLSKEKLERIGRVAADLQRQPAGSFVNNSNTFTASIADKATGAVKHAVNVVGLKSVGVPLGDLVKNLGEGWFDKENL